MNLVVAGRLVTLPVTHFTLTLLLAFLVSATIAAFGKRTPRERGHHAAYLFLSCLFAVAAGSWVMSLIHG